MEHNIAQAAGMQAPASPLSHPLLRARAFIGSVAASGAIIVQVRASRGVRLRMPPAKVACSSFVPIRLAPIRSASGHHGRQSGAAASPTPHALPSRSRRRTVRRLKRVAAQVHPRGDDTPGPEPSDSSCVSCSTATPRSASGTRCGSRVFVPSPEIGHVAGSKSISFHVASPASPDRTAVKKVNSISNLVAGSAPDSWTLATADAASRSCSARWWRVGGSVRRQRSG